MSKEIHLQKVKVLQQVNIKLMSKKQIHHQCRQAPQLLFWMIRGKKSSPREKLTGNPTLYREKIKKITSSVKGFDSYNEGLNFKETPSFCCVPKVENGFKVLCWPVTEWHKLIKKLKLRATRLLLVTSLQIDIKIKRNGQNLKMLWVKNKTFVDFFEQW